MSDPLYLSDDTGNYAFARPVSPSEILDLAEAILAQRLAHGPVLSSPEETRRHLALRYGHREREVFAVLFLDNRHRLITIEDLFFGTIDGASVHPREIVKRALLHNAAAVILAHNHPSGVAEPSQADQRITARIKEALSLVDVRVLDHFVIGGTETVSFAERGLL